MAIRTWANSAPGSTEDDFDWQASVLDKDLATPPGAPTPGDRYIIPAGGLGAWATFDEYITEWTGTFWQMTVPNQGMAAMVEDESISYFYDAAYPAGTWQPYGGAISHGDLLNLNADDHLQYLLTNGLRALTGDWDIGDGRKIYADEIRARDDDGLLLADVNGIGLFVEPGGRVGLNYADPVASLDIHQLGNDDGIRLRNSMFSGRFTNIYRKDDGFYVNTQGTGSTVEIQNTGTRQFLIEAGGNTIFGDGTPLAPVHVKRSPVATYGTLAIQGAAAGAANIAYISFVDSAGARTGYIGDYLNGSTAINFFSDGGNLQFGTGGTVHMLVHSSGKVGIGNGGATPDERLHIVTAAQADQHVKLSFGANNVTMRGGYGYLDVVPTSPSFGLIVRAPGGGQWLALTKVANYGVVSGSTAQGVQIAVNNDLVTPALQFESDRSFTFNGSGTVTGELGVQVISAAAQPTLVTTNRFAFWYRTGDGKLFLIFRIAAGDHRLVELS